MNNQMADLENATWYEVVIRNPRTCRPHSALKINSKQPVEEPSEEDGWINSAFGSGFD